MWTVYLSVIPRCPGVRDLSLFQCKDFDVNVIFILKDNNCRAKWFSGYRVIKVFLFGSLSILREVYPSRCNLLCSSVFIIVHGDDDSADDCDLNDANDNDDDDNSVALDDDCDDNINNDDDNMTAMLILEFMMKIIMIIWLARHESSFISALSFRYYVLHRLPNLKFLDSRPVQKAEKREAQRVGAYMKIVAPSVTDLKAQMQESVEISRFTPLPTATKAPGKHRGTFGRIRYNYSGKNSEGNRFIKNAQLWTWKVFYNYHCNLRPRTVRCGPRFSLVSVARAFALGPWIRAGKETRFRNQHQGPTKRG